MERGIGSIVGFINASVYRHCNSLVLEDGVKMPKKKKTTKVHRSAITGRFVKESTAKRSPKTTVTETVTRKKRGRK